MLRPVRIYGKLLGFSGLVLLFLSFGSAVRALPLKTARRRKLAALNIHFCSKLTLRLLGVRTLNDRTVDSQGNLLASNHLGYLDVLVIAAQLPGLFVTSVEVRQTPFLGLLSQMGGCLYVERRSKAGLSKEVSELTDGLQQGVNVILFPEATSTNGDEVLRFRRPLFQAAIDSKTKTIPMTINYLTINHLPFGRRNRDRVCWYGEMPFFCHLLDLFSQTEVTVRLSAHDAIPSESYPKEVLSELAHSAVSQAYRPVRDNKSTTTSTNSAFSMA